MAISTERLRKQMKEIGFVKGVEFRNVKGNAGQHILNGCYVLSKDKMMEGRGVYEYAGGTRYGYDDLVLFFDPQGRWRVASWGAHVEADENICYMMGCGQIGKTPLGGGYWQVYNGKIWETVPGVQLTPMSAEQVKTARIECVKRIQLANKELETCKGFKLKGVSGKHSQEVLNGA